MIDDMINKCLDLYPSLRVPAIVFKPLESGILGYYQQDLNMIYICSDHVSKSPIEAMDTIGHELAHCLVYSIFGNKVLDHGAQFRAIAQKLGVKPVSRRDSNYKIKQYFIYFDGDNSISVSKRTHNSIQKGMDYKGFDAEDWLSSLS